MSTPTERNPVPRPSLAGSVGPLAYDEQSGSGALADPMKEHDECHD